MLHAKEQYIKRIEPRGKAGWMLILGVSPDITWLHNSFNRACLKRDHKETFNGVRVINDPSKYKVNKAVRILRRHAMVVAINGVSGQVDEKVSAIFYYAALILGYVDEHTAMYEISPGQRCTIKTALLATQAGMEKDHQHLMEVADEIVDKLVDTLVAANTKRRQLGAEWRRHVDMRAKGLPYRRSK